MGGDLVVELLNGCGVSFDLEAELTREVLNGRGMSIDLVVQLLDGRRVSGDLEGEALALLLLTQGPRC
jgi:hypothetical protein